MLMLCAGLGAGAVHADPNVMNPGSVVFDDSTPYSIGFKVPLIPEGSQDTDANENSSVSIRFRPAAGGSWRAGYPPLLVMEENIGNGAPHHEGRNYSGAIWDLQPDTTYQIEFTFTDPDGYNETRTVNHATRSEPRSGPQNPSTVNVSTLSQLRTAAQNAQPGQVITVAAGTYRASSGDDYVVEFRNSGTAANPIVLRCADRESTILDAAGEIWVVHMQSVDHLYIEDCTLTGALSRPQRSKTGFAVTAEGDTDGFVFRRNIVRGCDKGLYLKNFRKTNIDVVDNWMEGPISFPQRGTSGSEGIVIHGSGNVVAHNTMRGYGDSIGTSRAQESTSVMGPHRHMLWYGNVVEWSEDDCFEFDYAHGNIIATRNKCMNYNSCFSAQPTFGGPFYFFRNVCWSGGMSRHLKIAMAQSTYGPPSGLRVFHNLIGQTWTNYYSDSTWDYVQQNNLFVGAPGNTIVDSSTRFRGRRADSGNHPDATIDHNAYNDDGSFRYGPGNDASNFATFQSRTSFEANGLIDDTQIFATPPAELPSSSASTRFVSIVDPRLASAARSVDAGTPIPNISDSFAGSAPDIGPYERGDSLYPYGIRGWSFDSIQCSDGIDNDGDGNIDGADPGCANGNDPSERGDYAQCDNGLDDDSDGDHDFPDDAQCSTAADTSEETGGGGGDPTDPPSPPVSLRAQ
ncbi:hypothetical protein ABI59_19075 [Acidobacteria bacterium Mor1]|nr:hypothetical protein ABI59_19075 [Acidobacteria bacterium Mor1]